MPLNDKVKRLLKENHMTKATLAKESGLPYTTLDSMLKRETDANRIASVFRIAKALGTSVESLVFDEGVETVSFSPEEKRILDLYALLDERGRSTVLSLLEREADNSKNETMRDLTVYEAPAAAGTGLSVLTTATKTVRVSARSVPARTDFAIRLSGDSMEPLFCDGDLVYIEQCEDLPSGKVGVFLLNGESLCKKYEIRDGETYLVSYNPAYAPIHVLDSDDLKLVGRVITSSESERKSYEKIK